MFFFLSLLLVCLSCDVLSARVGIQGHVLREHKIYTITQTQTTIEKNKDNNKGALSPVQVSVTPEQVDKIVAYSQNEEQKQVFDNFIEQNNQAQTYLKNEIERVASQQNNFVRDLE